jgi:hypothetical protein
VSIKTLLDLAVVSLDELIGRHEPVDEKMNRGYKDSLVKVNLMEDELVAHLSSHLKTSRPRNPESLKEMSSSSKGGRDHGHRRNIGVMGLLM